MTKIVRTAPVTSSTRRRAAGIALSQSAKTIRITAGQRKAIIGTPSVKRA